VPELRAGRSLGLYRATLVGVGAIVGGGVLALAGTAFAAAGPAAIVAFVLNGVIAFATARSFASMASAFPRSGGSYTFAKMVLSVRPAFAVGWVVWFASIVAGVLYALGFAVYAQIILQELMALAGRTAPSWLSHHGVAVVLAAGATAFYAGNLLRKPAGGGRLETAGKVVIFALFILVGLWALARDPAKTTGIVPFMPRGTMGLVEAMGFTFIALQGFDLIAAVGGEVRKPKRNIPRAMYLSLAIALLIYVPLLFVVATVGVSSGETIRSMSAAAPDTVIAVAARNIAGEPGFWLIAVAALLSMLSALQANVYAASRIAQAMARDRTLPWAVGRTSSKRGTPVGGVIASALLLLVILAVIPDVASAGAAASLIFLITFALVHLTALLANRRGAIRVGGLWRVLPYAGLLACTALALFQAIAVPLAGMITLAWLVVGGIFYGTFLARRAEAVDASEAARNPLITQARGEHPLVLLPIANPDNAIGLVSVAYALSPPVIGRVLLLSVVVLPKKWEPPEIPSSLTRMQKVLGDTLAASLARGLKPAGVMTVADDVWAEIARVANTRRCSCLLLGMTRLEEQAATGGDLERLMGRVDSDVVVLRAETAWSLESAAKILVPVGGRGGQDELRARLLGSLARTAARDVVYLQVLPQQTSSEDRKRAQAALRRCVDGEAPDIGRAEVVLSDDPIGEVAARTSEADLTIIGVQRETKRRKYFGQFALEVVRRTEGAVMLVSRRG
jgi:amino acid transporter